jgi:hypothetical protein
MVCGTAGTPFETCSDTGLGCLFARKAEMIATSVSFREYRATKNFYLSFFNYFPFIKPTVESLTPLIACDLPRKYCSIKYT